jgi:DNA (cytosine-5)-methyltransferase 1
VFVVGCLGDWASPAKILFESDCLRGDIKKGAKTREATTKDSKGSIGALCARDYKGIGNQYVDEGKCVVETLVFDRQSSGEYGIKNIASTISARDYKSATDLVATSEKNLLVVRRLTPIECERLQGFPDDYTNIKEKCPDGPRYKAMGNSMAVPVMRWIGQRMEELV